jgi:hypothetical protein
MMKISCGLRERTLRADTPIRTCHRDETDTIEPRIGSRFFHVFFITFAPDSIVAVSKQHDVG